MASSTMFCSSHDGGPGNFTCVSDKALFLRVKGGQHNATFVPLPLTIGRKALVFKVLGVPPRKRARGRVLCAKRTEPVVSAHSGNAPSRAAKFKQTV